MSLLLNILGAPLLGPMKLIKWTGEKISEVADQQLGDKESLKAELIEWQIKLELGEISQTEYDKKEKEILLMLKQ